jgi:hypothetical protein
VNRADRPIGQIRLHTVQALGVDTLEGHPEAITEVSRLGQSGLEHRHRAEYL